MMDFIHKLNPEAKVAIGLVMAEKMFNAIDIEDPGHKTGREALDNCWRWLEGEDVEADSLCNYIDSEDYIDVTEFANKEKNKLKQYAWYSVLDAVSYTIFQAYKKENREFVPQAIEVIDDETITMLGENVEESGYFKIDSINDVIKYLMQNYSSDIEVKFYSSIKKSSLDNI